jgi:hypothetical protein
MTDYQQGEDPSLASFGRHVLVGGLLGLCVGVSWEGMAWFWAAGQFAPLRLSVLGTSLGMICGFVTWLVQAGRERPRRHEKDGRREGTAASLYPGVCDRRRRAVNATRLLLACIACGVVCGSVCGLINFALHWVNGTGQLVYAAVSFLVVWVAASVFVWLCTIAVGNSNDQPTSTCMDPIGPSKHPGQPPAAFEHRLAAFLRCSEQELLRPRPRTQSKMPFWSIADVRSYVGPKPVWIIRRILERIRATMRRSRSFR